MIYLCIRPGIYLQLLDAAIHLILAISMFEAPSTVKGDNA